MLPFPDQLTADSYVPTLIHCHNLTVYENHIVICSMKHNRVSVTALK